MKKFIIQQRKWLVLLIFCIVPSLGLSKNDFEHYLLRTSWKCSIENDSWRCLKDDRPDSFLFSGSDIISFSEKEKSIVNNFLGWIESRNKKIACGGYYYQKWISTTPLDEVSVNARQYRYADSCGISIKGSVKVESGNQILLANTAKLLQNESNRFDQIDLDGSIVFSQPGYLAVGSHGNLDIDSNTATLERVYYITRITQNGVNTYRKNTTGSPIEIEDRTNILAGYGYGQADKVIQSNKTNFTLEKATYTIGKPHQNNWTISAKTIHLNKKIGIGKAYNILFYVRKIPILYWPYITFPLNNQRHTGFLYPRTGYSKGFGYYLSTPFYWNIASDYDLTITSTIYNHTGLLIDTNFRYLTKDQSGEFDIQYLVNKNNEGANHRKLSFTNTSRYKNIWSSYFNYQYISDRDFYNNFDMNNDDGTKKQALLNRSISVNYKGKNFIISGLINYYGNNKNVIRLSGSKIYSILPQVNINITYPDIMSNINLNWNNQFTYFYKQCTHYTPEGQRYHSEPKISFPMKKSWGSLIPSLTLHETLYTLKIREPEIRSGPHFTTDHKYIEIKNIRRSMLTIDMNLGIHLNYRFYINGYGYKQILRSELVYTYIPYRYQDNIPLFDTSLNEFNYTSLVQSQIFNGPDRINNTNQVGYRFEGILLQDNGSGKKILNTGFGQVIYFQSRKVALCYNKDNDCANFYMPFYNSTISKIALFLDYRFLSNWQLITSGTYNPKNGNMDSQNYQIQYMFNNKNIFNITYQSNRNNYNMLTIEQIESGVLPKLLSQITFSGIWNLAKNWSLAGLWSYEFSSRNTTKVFTGIHYDSCDWGLKLLTQYQVSSFIKEKQENSLVPNPLNNTFIIQIELKGFGSSNKNSLDERLAKIPEYIINGGFN